MDRLVGASRQFRAMGLESTREFLQRARDGDAAALDGLLARLRPRLVLWMATRMSPELRARIDPEDVAQEVLIRVHRDLGSFRGEAGPQFGQWLFRIAENRIRDAADYHGAAKRKEAPVPAEPWTTPGAAAVRSEDLDRIRDALSRLPPDHRLVIQYRTLEGRPDSEVAALLARSELAVRVLYCRALKSLRATLRESET